jgi:hypothetical protein
MPLLWFGERQMSMMCEIWLWQIPSNIPATFEATRTYRVGLFLLAGGPGRCIPAKSPDRVLPTPLDLPVIFMVCQLVDQALIYR